MEAPEILSGGDALIRALDDEGVELLFGYPGGAALHIYDALFRQDNVQHILVRHEQAAAHAADGYSRATGKVGTVLVTSGPGATNTLTGIATAYMDSIPLVVISAQVPLPMIGTDFFQETDMIGASRPMVKHSFMVQNPEEIPMIVRKSFYIAQSGRPGPVVIDVPKDMTAPTTSVEYRRAEIGNMRAYRPSIDGHIGQIKRALKLINRARRPVIYAGGGVVQGNASTQLSELAHLLNAPVTNTLMGLGAFPGTDKQFIGMLGMHGHYEANMAMHHCDLLLAVGARFDDRVTNEPSKFCPHAKKIHIDVDTASINKTITVDVPIVGRADRVLHTLLASMRRSPLPEEHKQYLSEWWDKIDSWRQEHGLYYGQRYATKENSIMPQSVIQTLYQVTDGNAYVTSDVGQHQMFAAQYYKFDKPRRWINSGGLGTMGFGLPAAMGVYLGVHVHEPDPTVVCLTGEGSIQMCIQELSTCLQYNLPIKIVNLNNQALGMVRQWQDMNYGGRYSSSLYQDSLPDFVKLAESYGHIGMHVDKPADLQNVLTEAISIRDRLIFVDVAVDPHEHVYPMLVSPNGAMCDMWLSKNQKVLPDG